jgi:hypothetical protein
MLVRKKRLWALAGLATAAVVVTALSLPGAEASMSQATVVSANPADFTPNVQDDAIVSNAAIYAFAQIGSTMYAGGRFKTITDAKRANVYPRSYFVAFNATTGAVQPLAPNFGAPVWALLASGNSLYVGGEFGRVNNVLHPALVKLDATTGAIDPAFAPPITSGKVNEIRMVGGRLIVGGTFTKRLMALNPASGADTNYINLPIAGTTNNDDGHPTEVLKFAVNPAGTRLVAVGNFLTVAGQSRPRMFMATLGATSATLNAWTYAPLSIGCRSAVAKDYVQDVDFAPDGSYFATVSGGGAVLQSSNLGTTLCDAAARFETDNAAPAKPTWINYTGGDTLHSVAVTGSAIYVQGHQRWLDNPQGSNSAGPGAVSRPGIGAINPATGKALSWNPGKDRGIGGRRFFVTPAGLWVGSDGRYFAGETRWGMAFLPL